MKILKRYLLSQLLGPFLIGIGIFNLIFFLVFSLELAQTFLFKGVSLKIVLPILLLKALTTFSYTVPMGALVANLTVWGRLNQAGEITAIKASGISLRPLILLVTLLSLLLSLSLYSFNDLLLPRLIQTCRGVLVKARAEMIPFDEGTFIKIGSYTLLIKRLDKRERRLERIHILYDSKEDSLPSYEIYAKSGSYHLENSKGHMYLRLFLCNGEVHGIDKDTLSRYHLSKFESHTLSIDTALEPEIKGVDEMTLSELKGEIRRHKSSGFEVTLLLVEFYKREAIPFACLAFTLIGIPLGLSIKRSGGAAGFGISLLFILIYYILLIGGESIALKSYLPAHLAIWIANLILISSGLLLIIKTLRR
ncbi:TPA: hypothetical protein DCX15_04125 [bacterium]|nr:hypothetical protein [bacterium]